MDWGNLVQVESWHSSTKKATTVVPQKVEDKTSNKQDTSTRSATFTPTHRFTTKAPASTQLMPTSKSTTALPAPSTLDRTEDYWVQEGHMWKRVHIQPLNELYIPQQTQHGPDITKLKADRVSFMNPQDGSRMTFDDQWTSQQQRRATDKTWTGSTNFGKKQHTSKNTSQMKKIHNKQLCQQRASKHRNNPLSKSAVNTV